jgi:hypothetical protein
MNTKIIGWISLANVVFIALMLISGLVFSGDYDRPETVEQMVTNVMENQFNRSFGVITYVLFTVLTVLFFAALYIYCKGKSPYLALFGIVFLPAYSILASTFASGFHVVSTQAAHMYQSPEIRDSVELLLKQFLPGSENYLNDISSLPYFFLGISALFFGLILMKDTKLLKITGYLLLINGAGYILGVFAVFIDYTLLEYMALVGALASLIALILCSIVFLKGGNSDKQNVQSV